MAKVQQAEAAHRDDSMMLLEAAIAMACELGDKELVQLIAKKLASAEPPRRKRKKGKRTTESRQLYLDMEVDHALEAEMSVQSIVPHPPNSTGLGMARHEAQSKRGLPAGVGWSANSAPIPAGAVSSKPAWDYTPPHMASRAEESREEAHFMATHGDFPPLIHIDICDPQT